MIYCLVKKVCFFFFERVFFSFFTKTVLLKLVMGWMMFSVASWKYYLVAMDECLLGNNNNQQVLLLCAYIKATKYSLHYRKSWNLNQQKIASRAVTKDQLVGRHHWYDSSSRDLAHPCPPQSHFLRAVSIGGFGRDWSIWMICCRFNPFPEKASHLSSCLCNCKWWSWQASSIRWCIHWESVSVSGF